MEYIHVRNLEKYHPGYKDRMLSWAKIHINMANGDPDMDLLMQKSEVDWSRLVRLILLELRAQHFLPLDNTYLASKGFDLKKRPIQLTLKMLHNFVDVVTVEKSVVTEGNPVTEDLKVCNVDKIREDKIREDKTSVPPTIESLKNYCIERRNAVDPDKFFSYYQSNGWKVGRSRMVDWKAAVHTWEKNSIKSAVVNKPEEPYIAPQKPDPVQQEEVAKLIKQTMLSMAVVK